MMVTPGMSFSESRMATKRGASGRDAVLRQEHDIGLAAQPLLYVGGRVVAERLSRQILRGVEQRCRGRRHDGADIDAGPHRLLEDRAERRRIDGRHGDPADILGEELPHLLGLPGGVVAGEKRSVSEPAVARRHGEAGADALDELALIVLQEGQLLRQRGRNAAARGLRIEGRQHDRNCDAAALLGEGLGRGQQSGGEKRGHEQGRQKFTPLRHDLHLPCPFAAGDNPRIVLSERREH